MQISRGRNLSVEGQQPKLDPLADRKRLTFEEAEGAEPLPQQLKLGKLSPLFRAAVWNIVFHSIKKRLWIEMPGPPELRLESPGNPF